MKKYEWNDETVDAFKLESSYLCRTSIFGRVVDFIDVECQLEDGDNEEEMVEDLMKKIYNETN
jgi:hypothetical protein